MPEAVVLESALSFYKRNPIIINLDTPEDVVRARMQGRAREDDTPESIEARLSWYRNETLPVVEHYRSRAGAHVYDIDGTASIDEVHAQILAALKLS